jgi:hypothetical protein
MHETVNPPGPVITRSYWIGVVSKEHVMIGVKGGFIQLNHGKRAPLQKLSAADGIVFYSPRVSYPDGEQLQSFTAIGRVKTGDVYQVQMTSKFKPFRADVRFLKAREAPIRALLGRLSFIKDKSHWGAPFRFGHLKIGEHDFALIAAAMGRDFQKDFAG